MRDATREHHVDWTDEVVAVFQKERTLLGKENFEALVDGDLRLVGFDLADIGTEGGIEDEAVVQDELGIESNLGLQGAAIKKWVGWVERINVAETAEECVGNQLDIARGGQIEGGGGSGLIEAALSTVGDSRPK